MLKSLSVKNFAIIEDITVEFNNGMTVLTGETGAGKSLIIDTISLLLGARADSDMIRYGEVKATIEGAFINLSDNVLELLEKYNISKSEELIITREIYDNSRNTIKINNTAVSLQILKNIAIYLADIHVQNDTYKLFNPENYLDILDPINNNKFDKLIADYSKALYIYLESIKEYDHIIKGQKIALERLEFLEYERDELKALGLYDGIDFELEDKIAKLSNYDKIFNSLNSAYSALNGDFSAIDSLYDAAKSLEAINEFDTKYNEFSEKLLDSYYITSEIKNDISRMINSLDFDEEDLNYSIETLNEINKAKDKYKKSVVELIEYLNKITIDIEMVTNYDEVLNESKNKCINDHKKLVEISKKLTEYRKNEASKLSSAIISECKDLDLENTKFEIVFENVDYSDYLNKSIFLDNGCDKISFMISFNKGEPLKMLHKVASGGEMSRIMLAFKSYLSKNNISSLMVFDEIDTGVSGSTAKKIANKMYSISKYSQVLCITHLPQVAAIGDYHKHIYKIEEHNRTITQIDDLDYQRRIEEIAMMLSGDKLSLYALEHAKALLEK